jgi:hypothetical protein
LLTFTDEILHDFVVFSTERINSVFDPSFDRNTPLPAETAPAQDGLPLLAPDDLQLNMRTILVLGSVSAVYNRVRDRILDWEEVLWDFFARMCDLCAVR